MNCPIPNAQGVCKTEGTGSCGVLILGEALGEQELADGGLPFRPFAPAGSLLERAINRIGARREHFVLYNALPTHPPKNVINKKWEAEAIEWGRSYVEEVIDKFKPRCILALGNTATRAVTGLYGDKLGVKHLAGYVLPHLNRTLPPVVAAFHPAYLRRGKTSHLGCLMRHLKLAIQVAREGRQPTLPPSFAPPESYILHPDEARALEFEREASTTEGYLAYDIETAYSNNEEEAEENPDAITSIQFSLKHGSGIFFPWREPFCDIARRLLYVDRSKITWNGWRFDNPLLRENGCEIRGRNTDLMWAWHHAQPDLPRGLQFAAAHQGLNIYNPTASWPFPWKHLSGMHEQFYGIVDVDVLQWMVSYAA